MQSISTEPIISLKDIIKEYYWLRFTAKDNRTKIPVIDDCSYDFVFHKEKNAILNYDTNETSVNCNSEIFTIHQLTPPYSIKFDNELTFFTVKLQPWMNGHFFSMINGNGVIDLTKFKIFNNDLKRQIFGQSKPNEKFSIINDYFLNLNINLSKNQIFVKEICEFIIKNKGLTSVNELSHNFQKSRQYLNKIFKIEVLYSLKKYITSVRILDLVHYKIAHPKTSLTEITYLYQYFDQAHFIKDFKNICGINPKIFFDNLPEFLLRHQ